MQFNDGTKSKGSTTYLVIRLWSATMSIFVCDVPFDAKTRAYKKLKNALKHVQNVYIITKAIKWAFFLAFGILIIELSLWKKHGRDGKFEHCVCMCACITMRMGAHDLFSVSETIRKARLFPWPTDQLLSSCNEGSQRLTENPRLQYRA